MHARRTLVTGKQKLNAPAPEVLSPSDEQLMMEVREGNLRAFDELVERHYERMVFFLSQMLGGDEETARDLAQEAFLRVFRARERYEPRAPWLAWMRKIARNLVYDERRRRRHGVVCSLDEPQIVVGNGERLPLSEALADEEAPDPGRLLAEAESLEEMRHAIAALSPKHTQVLEMRLYQEMNYQEIAEALGCSLGTVKSRIHYAVRELQQRIGPEKK
ncbi:MAG: sigma-24 [Candidatus Poribacteria bacterium]|nr:MAG: sigma-24 [Candidatus Poribacteria bacterium]